MQLTRRELAPALGLAGFSAWAGQWNAAAHQPAASHRQVSHRAAPHKEAGTSEQIWADLMEGNRRFRGGQTRPRNLVAVRKELVTGQHPRSIILGCSDSRVAPELVFDQTLGELFVVRTAGNVADPVALGSIEYAAEHLHAPLLVVLGHEGCGAVGAALTGEKMPTPGLEAVTGHIHTAIERVKALASGEELARLVVTMNVYQSAADLVAGSAVLKEEVATGKLTIIKAVYRLASGEVVRL